MLRYPPSKSIVLVFNTTRAKEEFEKRAESIKEITLQKRNFTILFHGLQVSAINLEDKEGFLKQLEDENPHLKNLGIKINNLYWSLRAIKEGKKYSSLYCQVSSPREANFLLERPLSFNRLQIITEAYFPEAKFRFCSKCQKFNHTARNCLGKQRCGACAGEHTREQCPSHPKGEVNRKNPLKCPNCHGNHGV